MEKDNIWITVVIVLIVALLYLLSVSHKQASILTTIFLEETGSMTNLDDQSQAIESVINKKVTNKEKNEILKREKENIYSVAFWLISLYRYSIDNKDIRHLSIEAADGSLKITDYINTLIDKDISDFDEKDISFLKNYKAKLTIVSKNASEIINKVEEAFIIPFYTENHIKDNILSISNTVIK